MKLPYEFQVYIDSTMSQLVSGDLSKDFIDTIGRAFSDNSVIGLSNELYKLRRLLVSGNAMVLDSTSLISSLLKLTEEIQENTPIKTVWDLSLDLSKLSYHQLTLIVETLSYLGDKGEQFVKESIGTSIIDRSLVFVNTLKKA